MNRYLSHSPEETTALGKTFGSSLKPGDIVALMGNLGSGKTRFVSGVCAALGVKVHVGSPTFTLINEYAAPFGTVVHIDMYRIGRRDEIAELGIEEYFVPSCICLIEWAEAVMEFLPSHYRVDLTYGREDNEREIVVHTPAET